MANSAQRSELERARDAYARENPERARMLPFGNDVQYHLINAVNFLIEAVEELNEQIEHQDWVSNAGPVEIASDDRPECLCWMGTEIMSPKRTVQPRNCPVHGQRERELDDEYEGEAVDCKWDDYPSTDTRIGEQGE